MSLMLALLLANLAGWRPASTALAQDQTPTPDPLALPELPEHPTQVDLGRVAYYYHCMPCHGDQGQGLTDEWRQTWVDDHQDCWARGCHGGHGGDEGFPLPDKIPAVMGGPDVLGRFSSTQSLYEYLQVNHPPQRPGALTEADYWALTAFLLSETGRLPAGPDLSQRPTPLGEAGSRLGLALAGTVILGGLAIWPMRTWRQRRRQENG